MESTNELLTLIATILTGGFLVFLAGILIAQKWMPTWARVLLSFVLAFLAALSAAWLNGDIWNLIQGWGHLSAAEVMTFFVFFWTTATVWYKVVFKDTGWVNSVRDWTIGSKSAT